MGLKKSPSVCTIDSISGASTVGRDSGVVFDPNPNPHNFRLTRAEMINGFTIAEVVYPNCTNYEGKKILIFQADIKTIGSLDSLDPHFCESENHISPIARFEPTDRGWEWARRFVESIT